MLNLLATQDWVRTSTRMKYRKCQTGGSAHRAKQPAVVSLDRLTNAIFLDILPSDRTTNEIWGFNRAMSTSEGLYGRNCLLGLYQGLVKVLGIYPQQLDQWRQHGTLVPEIKKVFEVIPESCRGAYYPWLLRNEYVLDRSQPIPSNFADIEFKVLRKGLIHATVKRPAYTPRRTIIPNALDRAVLLLLQSGVHPCVYILLVMAMAVVPAALAIIFGDFM
ncbi:hypothetical protein BKA70DRAFT_1223027 [Coprinopsis sp. MPI-PUGE-AT-0042]|nr:hypothetical protein BKA70DRAFT_1223027 [Coprinopsis sp. MPI-PUGE-AT-0042]